MPKRTLFLDIASLTSPQWTGIPRVNQQLALHLLDHHPRESRFFVDGQVIDPRYVEVAVREAPGGYLGHFIRSGEAVSGPLHEAIRACGPSAGLFTNIKPFHNVFDVELIVAYDLSPLLMPEVHTPENAAHHARGLVADCRSSDLICCISEATRADLELYIGVPRHKTFVAHLAASEGLGSVEAPPLGEPYAVVLGTLEPRKNLRLVAELLRCRPEICSGLALLFIGREGWGPKMARVFAGVIDNPLIMDRLAFTGYLSDADKNRLLRGARFSIYPSLFEGFGLPVLESMALGCPVIAARTSSIVELGLPDDYLFDPLCVGDFSRAFDLVNGLEEPERAAVCQRLGSVAGRFTWASFCEKIVSAVRAIPMRQAIAESVVSAEVQLSRPPKIVRA